MAHEQLSGSEHLKSPEAEASSEVESRPKSHEVHHEQHETKPADLEAIKHKIEQEAKSTKETPVEEAPKAQHSRSLNQRVKSKAFEDTLADARAHLSAAERSFSKVVHQPVIDRISETSARTIARPVSLLTASLIALIGSSVVLFAAHRYGFRYNLFLFFALFVSGYLVGLIIEALMHLVRSPRR